MLLSAIVFVVGFVFTCVYVYLSRSKAAPKRTFIIAVFLSCSTLALGLASGFLQNDIASIFEDKKDVLQKENSQSSNNSNYTSKDTHTSEEDFSSMSQGNNNNNTISDDSADLDSQKNPPTNETTTERKLIAKELNEKWGYVNHNGEIVIPFLYDYAEDFFEDYAAVRIGDHWGFINEAGKTVIPFSYDGAWSFINGIAPVFQDRLWGFIDKNENVVIPFQYEDIYRMGSTYYDSKNDSPIKY